MKTHNKRDVSSVTRPRRMSFQSLIIVPKVSANTGPIIGDTNMEATIATVLFVARPIPAIVEAMMSRDK